MLTERNPYDPIEVKLPSFTYWMKAGAGLMLGAGIVAVTAAFLWGVFILGVLSHASPIFGR